MMKNALVEGRRWFQQAEYETRAAHTLVDNMFDAAACFFAHQAAEKYLKALLYAQGERRVIGHSINDLCDQCAQYVVQFTHLQSRIRQLDRYYIPTRYPNGLPGGVPAEIYDESDSAAALEMVALTRAAVIEAVPDLVADVDHEVTKDE